MMTMRRCEGKKGEVLGSFVGLRVGCDEMPRPTLPGLSRHNEQEAVDDLNDEQEAADVRIRKSYL